MKKLLTHSFHAGDKIQIIYCSNDNKISQRTIKVIKINNVNVLAFCYMKHKIRVFNVANILAIEAVYRKPG